MRVLQVTDGRKLEEIELPTPEPGEGEAVVEIAFCGICGSDLHMLPSPVISPGTVMGHEFSGTISALGDGVEGWSVGDRVCVLPGTPCGSCPSCAAGHEHLCAEATIRGHGLGGRQGAYAERIAVDASSLFALPDGVSDEHGALVEPLAVGVHAVRLAAAGPSQLSSRSASLHAQDPVCVLGAGPIGVMTSLALRAEGFERVVVVEPGESRRAKIEALGFDAVPLEGVHDAVIAAFGGELPAAVLECAGHPSALGLALELVRPRGTAMAVGVLEEPVPVNQLLLILKEAVIRGAFAYEREDFERAIELLDGGGIPAGDLVTDVVPLAEAQVMFEELVRPGTSQLKVLLKP